MALVKRTYVDGETIITAQNLNDIQDEIISLGNNTVPKTRTINGKALSGNITLNAGDVGYSGSAAYSSGTVGKEISDLDTNVNNLSAKTALPINPCIKEERLIAHQGGTSFTQSTDLCFKQAINDGFKILEGDIQKTSDDNFIIWHDSVLGGLTVASSTLAALQAVTFTDGSKALSLEEFVKLAISNSIAVEIDFTHMSTAELTSHYQTIYNAIKAINPTLDSVIFTAAYAKLIIMETVDPSIIICYSGLGSYSSIGDNVKRLARNSRFFMFSQSKSSIDADVVQWSHNNGYFIKAYTVVSDSELFSALADGADKAIVESVLPVQNNYAYVGWSNDWIYDARVSTDSSAPYNTGLRIINSNLYCFTFAFKWLKSLANNSRSVVLLPAEFRPIAAATGSAVYGSTAQAAGSVCLCGVGSTGYLNIYHEGRININDSVIGTLWYYGKPYSGKSST